MMCPQCSTPLAAANAGWLSCPVCRYEITEEAGALYVELSDAFESDPAKFFRGVAGRLNVLRDQEPVWQRRS